MADARGGLEVRLRQAAPIPLDASLGCAEGELLALVGPSGAGKTTILRAIAGLIRPREGRIACAGATWFDAAAGIERPVQARRVGFVFQDYALFPHLSARGNVVSALGHLRRDERARRADALLGLVHLAGLEDRRPDALSGGQRQRVALARALARDPAALLLDEPFAAVDQVTRRKLQHELALLRRAIKCPVVLVTHDLEEATALADRMSVLHRGATLQHGRPAEVFARPASPLVARLMDQPNVFGGRVTARDSARGVLALAWRGHALEVRDDARFAPGDTVAWMIPSAAVIMHRRERPSRGERENPIAGTVADVLVLGDTAEVRLRLGAGADAEFLIFSVAAHTARRNELAPGCSATVSLLAADIHLMPPG
jgi:molybdate transport system ATP-binding protein